MSSARRDTKTSDFNPKVYDPIGHARRNILSDQPPGVIMQPVQLSLVIGRKGSGVSSLLRTFAERADMQDTLIVDEDGSNGANPPLSEGWNSDAIAVWLHALQTQHHASHITLAASDLRAPRHLLQALAQPKLRQHFRLSAITGVASSLTLSEAAGRVGAGFDGTAEREEARGSTIITDPALRRLFTTADRIILTHTDRARPEAVTKLAKVLKALNPPAPILRARYGDIGPARLVDSGLFDPITGSVDIDRWLCEAAFGFEASRRGISATNLGEVQSTLGRSAAAGFFAVTIDQPLDGAVLSVFLKLLMADRGTDLLRLKGIVATKDHPNRPALIDARDHLIQPLLWLESWPTADHRGRLVFTTADTHHRRHLRRLDQNPPDHAQQSAQAAVDAGAADGDGGEGGLR